MGESRSSAEYPCQVGSKIYASGSLGAGGRGVSRQASLPAGFSVSKRVGAVDALTDLDGKAALLPT